MRIRDMLFAIAFRAKVREGTDDARRVQLFANAILSMFRPKSKRLSSSPRAWKTEVHGMYPNSPPLRELEKAWRKTKGGCGYRDVWDVLAAASRHADTYNAFIAFATAPRFLEIVVNGKAGQGARNALEKALYRHLPMDVTVVDTETLLKLAKGEDVQDRIRAYCEAQEYRLRLDRERVNAGIINHFMKWVSDKSGVPCPRSLPSMPTEEVVSTMMSVGPLAKEYIDWCTARSSETPDLQKVLQYATELWE